MAFKVPLTGGDWSSIISFIGLSILYITLFIGIGILVSAITRNSSLSFLLLLVIWIGGVMILPRLGVMAAGQLVPVESVAQLEAKQEAYQKARWDQYSADLSAVWQARETEMEGMTPEERQVYRDDMEWEWLEEDDASRLLVRTDIVDNNRRLLEDAQNKKRVQERLAFNIARISPVSSYQLAAMKLAGTDIDLKVRYEESMRAYKDEFTDYVQSQQALGGGHGGFNISMDSESGVSIDFGRNDQTLDTSEMPQYSASIVRPSEAIARSIPDFGMLSIFIILAFGGSFFAFLRYDMR